MHSLYRSSTRGPEDDSVESKHVAPLQHYMFNFTTVVFDGTSPTFYSCGPFPAHDTSAARIRVGCRQVTPGILDDLCYLPCVASASGWADVDTWSLIHGGCYHVTRRRTARSVRLALKVVSSKALRLCGITRDIHKHWNLNMFTLKK